MKIGLDCGHGLYTAGKQTPDGIKEWTLNDKVRDKVVELLNGYNVTFVFTDNDEGSTDEGLTTRRLTYINQNVDVFVSIHHNAYSGTWNNATGVEIYTDKNYTDADNKLAEAIYKRLPEYTGLKGRGIKRSNWTVINQNQVPAVLVEGGFMDSKKDYAVITTEAGQNGYAKAVAEGLIEFLGLTKTVVEQKGNEVNYTVKINTASLNVRADAGMEYAIKTKVKKNEVYTIVEEKNGWGKLKSGAGWINLSYTVRTDTAVKNTVTYYKACASNHTSLVSALNSIGVTSSFSYRKKIAKKNGITLYVGSKKQNLNLLSKLKAGKLIKV